MVIFMLKYDKDEFMAWLNLVEGARLVKTVHIGEFFQYISRNRYKTSGRKPTDTYRHWYKERVKEGAENFLPYFSWVKEFAEIHKLKVVYSDAPMIPGFHFALFTEEQYNGDKKTD